MFYISSRYVWEFIIGHTEAVLSVCFSPDGKMLASASGDTTVRIWDLFTETPRFTLKGHTNWVQLVCWSPDNNLLVSGSMDNTVFIFNASYESGIQSKESV